MKLTYYYDKRKGTINIENVNLSGGKYTTYHFETLSQAKRKHRKYEDLQNVIIEWVHIDDIEDEDEEMPIEWTKPTHETEDDYYGSDYINY